MTNDPAAHVSRHLVDPSLSAALDAFPGLDVTTERLEQIRQNMARASTAGPNGAVLYPEVERREVHIPSGCGDPDVRLLVYTPNVSMTARAALLWMHPGGFVLGSADDDDLLCRRIARDADLVVVSVDYRLAPETPAPGPLNDCYAALHWVAAQADQLGVDATRIAVGGASAGGGLAACLAVLARDRAEIAVSRLVLAFPMLDDRTAHTQEPSRYAGEFVWTRSDNTFGWTALLGKTPGGPSVSAYEAAARVETTAGLPPTFLGVGSIDLFVEEDIAFATRLIRAGVPVELHVYPGAFHGFVMAPQAWITAAWYADLLAALSRHGRIGVAG